MKQHIIPGKAIIELHGARSIVLRNWGGVGWSIEVHHKGAAAVSVKMDSEAEAKAEFDRICAAIAPKEVQP